MYIYNIKTEPVSSGTFVHIYIYIYIYETNKKYIIYVYIQYKDRACVL